MNSFWVGQEKRKLDANQVLSEYEAGRIHDETPIRVEFHSDSKPFRRYVRELVFTSYKERVADEAVVIPPIVFQTAFEQAPIGMVLSDLTGRITHVNDSFVAMLGYPAAELVGMRVTQLEKKEDRTTEVARGNRVISGADSGYHMEKSFLGKDGQVVETLTSVAMVRDESGVPSQVIGQIVDITERNSFERALGQADKLATAGRMVGEVAHDFKSLVTIIDGQLDRLKYSNAAELQQGIHSLREATSVARRFAQEMMGFSREGSVPLATIDLNDGIRNIRTVLTSALTGRATLRFELADSTLPVKANLVWLEKILMSLVFNARNATNESCTIHVRTEDLGSEGVMLIVEDNGTGMSEEVLSRAFEPFFTTRSSSGVSGLGLPVVESIVTRFNGKVHLESALGVGTKCVVLFPKAALADLVVVDPLPEAPPKPKTLSDTAARVLLVDDQRAIVRIVNRLLMKKGYAVVTAESVEDATKAIHGAEVPFDLLLGDINLPDGDGLDIAEVARTRWPEIQVLFMSGQSRQVIEDSKRAAGPLEFIQKPFMPGDLLQRIGELTG